MTRREMSQVVLAPRFLSIDDAATYTSLSPATLKRMVVAGKLTPKRPTPGRVLFDREELDRVILEATEPVKEKSDQ